MAFDAKAHLTNIKGKQYLEAKWRLVWLREEHPTWRIGTEVIQTEPFPMVKCTIADENGAVVATGHGTAQIKAGTVYSGRELEKAETAAIARAAAHAGFGTQFTEDDDTDNLADSPVQKPQNRAPQAQGATTQPPQAQPSNVIDLDATFPRNPPIKAWTDAEIKLFVKQYRDATITDGEVLRALEVSGLREWKGTLEQAHIALDAYIAAQMGVALVTP